MKLFLGFTFAICLSVIALAEKAQAQPGANPQNQNNAFGNAGGQPGGGGGFSGQGGGQNFSPGNFNNPQQRRFNQQRLGNRGQFNQRRFIGGDANEMRQRMREFFGGQRRNQFFDFQIDNLNDQRRSEQQQGGDSQERPPVRVQLRPRFDYQRIPESAVSANVNTSLTRILSQRNVTTPEVELADRIATLRGFVTSAEESDLIEKLVAMEPGVSQVENLLEVQSTDELISPAGR